MTERNNSFKSSEKRQSLLRNVFQKISSGGLSEEELNSERNNLVAPGVTVGDLIEGTLDLGDIEWENGKLVNVRK